MLVENDIAFGYTTVKGLETAGNDVPNYRTINNIISKLRKIMHSDSSLKINNIKRRGYILSSQE